MKKGKAIIIVGAQWGDVEPFCGRERPKRSAGRRESADEILSEAKEL